jgi:hypothetical protein
MTLGFPFSSTSKSDVRPVHAQGSPPQAPSAPALASRTEQLVANVGESKISRAQRSGEYKPEEDHLREIGLSGEIEKTNSRIRILQKTIKSLNQLQEQFSKINTACQEALKIKAELPSTATKAKRAQAEKLLRDAQKVQNELSEIILPSSGKAQTGEERVRAVEERLKSRLEVAERQLRETEEKLREYQQMGVEDTLRQIYQRFFDAEDVGRLEGWNTHGASQTFRNDLNDTDFQRTLDEQQKHAVREASSRLDFADKIHASLEEIYSKELDPKNARASLHPEKLVGPIIDRVAGTLKDLPVGSSIILHGGHPCHAVLFEIVRTGANTFSFSVLNTGDGAVGVNLLHLDRVRNYTIDNISLEHMTDTKFLKDLLSIKYEEMKNRPLPQRLLVWLGFMSDMSKVYTTINAHLLKSGRKRPKEQCLHYRTQQHGTCSSRCIDTWLAHSLGKDLYGKFYTFSYSKRTKPFQPNDPRLVSLPSVSFLRRIHDALDLAPIDEKSSEYRKIARLVQKRIAAIPKYPIVESKWESKHVKPKTRRL